MTEATGASKHVQPLVQDCWTTMRRGSNMKKVWVGDQKLLLGQSRKNDTKRKVNLTKDQTEIVYHLKKNEKRIQISEIKNVLTPETNPAKFKSIEKRFPAESCFAVATTTEDVFFVACTCDEANLWVTGIKSLIINSAKKNLGKERREKWLRKEFGKLDKNNDNAIKYVDLLNFLTSQGLHAEPRLVKKFLKKFLNSDKLQNISCDEFIGFLDLYLKRDELRNLFIQCSSNGSYLTVDDLRYFLISRQFQPNVTREQCQRYINTYEVTQDGRTDIQLGIHGFIKFMSSVEGELFNPEHDTVYQDMGQPFAHYFIASSHNTYLVGDQLKGESSVAAYAKVLREGCRCVELDCWDGDNDEPVVYHGHTLTSKILFKDILKVVKRHAFETSPYPVILNLENHCKVDLQKKMALYLVDILGDHLQKEPVDEKGDSASPDRFKCKIFVRAKKLKPDAEKSDADYALTDDESDDDDDDDDDESVHDGNDEQDAQANKPKQAKQKPKKPPKAIAKDFSLLINYFSNTHFNSFEDSAQNGKHHQSSSFAEKKMRKFVVRHPQDLVEYNKKQLSRIYPGGLRIDSSNYEPQEAWNVGCQIVALNHQTRSVPVQLHHGKFRQNGKAGYVLKPEFLRTPGVQFHPRDVKGHEGMSRILKVTIVSGHRLSLPESTNQPKIDLDPYVEVKIFGVPADELYFKTRTINNNNYNPKWMEGFEKKLLVPDLALIRFCVYDDDIGIDDFIGQATIPIASMRQGYRHVILLNKKGDAHTSGCLFLHVTISEGEIETASASQVQLNDTERKSKSVFSRCW